MKKYLRKNVPFDPDNKEEMTLYQWLQSLPHGKFSEVTKKYWMKKMEDAERQDCPVCINQRPRGCRECNGTGFKIKGERK
jgi:hypothetical protein